MPAQRSRLPAESWRLTSTANPAAAAFLLLVCALSWPGNRCSTGGVPSALGLKEANGKPGAEGDTGRCSGLAAGGAAASFLARGVQGAAASDAARREALLSISVAMRRPGLAFLGLTSYRPYAPGSHEDPSSASEPALAIGEPGAARLLAVAVADGRRPWGRPACRQGRRCVMAARAEWRAGRSLAGLAAHNKARSAASAQQPKSQGPAVMAALSSPAWSAGEERGLRLPRFRRMALCWPFEGLSACVGVSVLLSETLLPAGCGRAPTGRGLPATQRSFSAPPHSLEPCGALEGLAKRQTKFMKPN